MVAWPRLPSQLAARLARQGGLQPTPCQQQVLEALMPRSPSQAALLPRKPGALIQWATGSGKTLAFALPMVARAEGRYGLGLQGLVIAPTRELVIQTKQVLVVLAGHGKRNKKGNSIKVMSILGDLDMMRPTTSRRMLSELNNEPPDFAVATPKIIRQLMEDQALPLRPEHATRTLVLDEIDTLASPPHWEDVQKVRRASLLPTSPRLCLQTAVCPFICKI